MDLAEYRNKRNNGKFKIVFFYSIGRSGTAYLYQVLGQKPWKPHDIAFPPQGNVMVVHEKFAMTGKEVEKLKLVKPTSKEGLAIQRKRLNVLKNTCIWNNCETLVITDSCFGRWCPYYIIQNCDYQAVFLDRDRESLIKSWTNLYRTYAKKYTKVKAKGYIANRFKNNYFNITDKYTLLHVDKDTWKKYSLKQKIGWYHDEAKIKWNELKKDIPEKKFFETSYEKVTTVEGLKDLSDFLKIPFNYDLMRNKVNVSEYL